MVVRIGQIGAARHPIHFREWREHRKLTQQQVADLIGTTKGAVSKLENGSSLYNQSSLEAWAMAMRCSPADLLSPPPQDSSASLDKLLSKATPEVKAQALAIVKALLGKSD